MPRIDPLQLLKCLSVLLTPEGGILSRDEVPRLVNLMTKFSKKLVSKCVYVLILKNTNTELVDMFMAEGGWTLIQTWLQDAVQIANWHLVREILGLLLITPVDVERLKLNILPKLIKSLSRRDDLEDVAELSTQLVKQWLTIVKGSSLAAQQSNNDKADLVKSDDLKFEKDSLEAEDDNIEPISTASFYKKDAKEANDKIESNIKDDPSEKTKSKEEDKKSSSRSSSSKSSSRDKERSKDKDRHRDKDRRSSSKSSSSSSRSKSSSSSSKDRKDREKDRKDRDKSRDKDKDKDKERDKQRSNGSTKSSSSSSKDKKESSEKKDKDKPDKERSSSDFKPLEKFGRIPKKSSSETIENKDTLESKKKFSVGIRKDREERPKTVKIFNSRMRSTGLEEEAKPAPSRPVKKVAPPAPLPPPMSLKRASPSKDIKEPVLPPEKKIKIDKVDIPERPGAIKLIPPKPKRCN